MITTILVLAVIGVLLIVFSLGRRWEAFRIRTQMLETGTATSRWGEHSKIKIIGTVKDIKA